MKRDQIIIFLFVGIMTFSSIASGLLFLNQDSNNNRDTETNANSDSSQQGDQLVAACEPSADSLTNAGSPMGDWPTTINGTLSELGSTDLREGTGAELKIGDCIAVHYRLSLADGTPVSGNNTYTDRGQPIAFELVPGGLIDGWTQGLPGMKEGGVRRLMVPASLAYGDAVRPGIPASSDLIFDVELVKIENTDAAQ